MDGKQPSDWRSLRVVALAAILLAIVACKPPMKAFAELEYPVPTQSLRIGTADVVYTELGAGERTLVLIHGLGSYLPVWKNNLEALARDHRVVAIDLPGYGKSSKANYSYSMEFFAKVVRGVVRELDLERVTLVGHSMGGQVAMTYALMYPADIEALVLTSPAGLETFEDGEAKWLADAVTPDFACKASPESIYARLVQNFYSMPKDATFMYDDRVAVIGGPDFSRYCRAVARSVAAMLDEPVHHRIPKLDLPTLVVFGDTDQLIPNPFLHGGSTVRLAKKAVARFPNAELVILPRAGHMAQFERATPWNDAVLRFLGDARSVGAMKPQTPVKITEGIVPLFEPGTDPDEQPVAEAPAAPVAEQPEPEPEPEPEPATSEPELEATPAPTDPQPIPAEPIP